MYYEELTLTSIDKIVGDEINRISNIAYSDALIQTILLRSNRFTKSKYYIDEYKLTKLKRKKLIKRHSRIHNIFYTTILTPISETSIMLPSRAMDRVNSLLNDTSITNIVGFHVVEPIPLSLSHFCSDYSEETKTIYDASITDYIHNNVNHCVVAELTNNLYYVIYNWIRGKGEPT